jgi:hypothetical protein
MLEKAKEVQKTKPVAPPIKHERTKILTKEERMALRAAAAGKKTPPAVASKGQKPGEAKADIKDKRKPAEIGYQGTARPAKKPEISYKGTARPSNASGPAGKSTGLAAKAKPKKMDSYGYADWSDLEDEELEDDEDDGYESPDMEGNLWELEEEEQRALKVAKEEDAKALAEEAELKRQKEERKRKLESMSKAAATKRKY